MQHVDRFEFIPRNSIRRWVEWEEGTILGLIIVTPDMALDWLTSRNPVNRRIKEGAVDRYSCDMTADRWVSSLVDPIHFDEDGNLLNGQHRLEGVVTSERPVLLTVQLGCPRAWAVALDCGMARTQTDQEKIAFGFEVTKDFVATGRSMRIGIQNSRACFSTADTHEFLVRHEGAIRFSLGLFPKHIKSVTTAPMKAVVARAFYSHSPERLAEFAGVMQTGRSTEPWHSSVILLREWMRGRGSGGGDVMAEHYSKTSRALQALLNRQSLGRLYEATSELFPLPGEAA